MELGKRVATITVVVSVVATIIGLSCGARHVVPLIEQQYNQLNKSIMCPVCPGESIDQSQNALAGQMRGIVITKLEEGRTIEEIEDFFVDRYGPSVLLDPPKEGFILLIWIIPPIMVVAAVISLYIVLMSMRNRTSVESGSLENRSALSEEEIAEYSWVIGKALDDSVEPPSSEVDSST